MADLRSWRRMRRGPCSSLLVATLAVAACHHSGQEKPDLPPDQLVNAIENVRQLKDTPPPPPKRLSFLTQSDLSRVKDGNACILHQGNRTLLVAGAARALARVDGRPVLLDLAGPMDASAAFFRGPRVTISIGRHMTVTPKDDVAGVGWPVGVTVGAVPQGDVQKLDAIWSCATPRAVHRPVAWPG